jgi:hypothetical protein
MTSDTGDKGSGPHKPPHSGRRAPTIDLKAKEVASEAVAPAKPSSSEPADTAGPAAAANPGKGAPQDAKPETDAGGVPPRAPGWRWPAWDSLPGRPSPLFGAAFAAAIVFFVLGFITASFFSRNDVASDTRLERIHADERLTERLTKIEASLAAPRSPDAGLLARIATAEAAAKLAARRRLLRTPRREARRQRPTPRASTSMRFFSALPRLSRRSRAMKQRWRGGRRVWRTTGRAALRSSPPCC